MTSRCFGSACFDFICNQLIRLRLRPVIGLLFRLLRFYEILSRNILFQNSSKNSMVWSIGTLLISCYHSVFEAGIAQSVQRLATGWTFRGSNVDGGETFCTPPVRPWGPRSHLYDGYRVFPGRKAAGACS